MYSLLWKCTKYALINVMCLLRWAFFQGDILLFWETQTMSMNIVDHSICVACTMGLICHLGHLDCAHVSEIAFIHDRHFTMLHDIYTLCVASNSWITCSYHMFGCNNVISSHMPCRIACHMIDFITSHMMNKFSFNCVECHTNFTTPMHVMLGLSRTWPMCLDTSFYLVWWMLHMPTINRLLSALCMLAMTLR